jgi:uncharacterized membrane protein
VGDLRTVAGKRLDGLVDGAFAFSITILIVGAGDSMNSYDGLLATFAQVPAFALSLLVILSFWWAHRQFSLISLHNDWINDALSIVVMFVIMIYVYPVSFLTRSLTHWLSDAALPGTGLLPHQIRSVYEIFGAGFALLSIIYAIMYARSTYLNDAHGPYVPMRFKATAKRASYLWAVWAVAALFSMLTASFGGLDWLIWFPLLPYGLAMALLIGWRLLAPIPLQPPLDEDDLAEMQRLMRTSRGA